MIASSVAIGKPSICRTLSISAVVSSRRSRGGVASVSAGNSVCWVVIERSSFWVGRLHQALSVAKGCNARKFFRVKHLLAEKLHPHFGIDKLLERDTELAVLGLAAFRREFACSHLIQFPRPRMVGGV